MGMEAGDRRAPDVVCDVVYDAVYDEIVERLDKLERGLDTAAAKMQKFQAFARRCGREMTTGEDPDAEAHLLKSREEVALLGLGELIDDVQGVIDRARR